VKISNFLWYTFYDTYYDILFMYIYVPVMSNNFFLKYKDAKRILEKHVKVNKYLPFITNVLQNLLPKL